MTKFNCNDFLSDKLPKGGLFSSQQVREIILKIFDFNGEIMNIFLVGRGLDGTALYQWAVVVKIEGQDTVVFIPVYIPEDSQAAGLLLKKHRDVIDVEPYVYQDGDYLILDNKYPCLVYVDSDKNIFIKKIELWASQKMVQDFLSLILNADVYSTLILTTSQIGQSEKYHDIGWFICTNEKEMFIPLISVGYTFEKYASLIERKDIDVGTTFALNSQRYAVAEDQENGLYLCKVD